VAVHDQEDLSLDVMQELGQEGDEVRRVAVPVQERGLQRVVNINRCSTMRLIHMIVNSELIKIQPGITRLGPRDDHSRE
jgi:hypothetical protein